MKLVLSISCLLIAISICYIQLNLNINITSSIPIGIYRLDPNDISLNKGKKILFCLNGTYRKIAKERKYLSSGKCPSGLSPIGKQIVAEENDRVQLTSDGIIVNGVLIQATKPLIKDSEGRTLIHEKYNRKLKKNEVIVASSKNESFDSRYYGIVKKEDILGIIKEVITL